MEIQENFDNLEQENMVESLATQQQKISKITNDCNNIQDKISDFLHSIQPLKHQVKELLDTKTELTDLVSHTSSDLSHAGEILETERKALDSARSDLSEIVKICGLSTSLVEVTEIAKTPSTNPRTNGTPDSSLSKKAMNIFMHKRGSKLQACVFFNKDCCTAQNCPFEHVCGYCGQDDHPFYKCNTKKDICRNFNHRDDCFGDCHTDHVCLLCHEGSHGMERCKKMQEHRKKGSLKELMRYCLNWNRSAECIDKCKRIHKCVSCFGKHASLDCPSYLAKLLDCEESVNTSNKVLVNNKKPKFTHSEHIRWMRENPDLCLVFHMYGNCDCRVSCRYNHACSRCGSKSHGGRQCKLG